MAALTFDLEFNTITGKISLTSSGASYVTTYTAKVAIKDPTGAYIYNNLVGAIDDVTELAPNVADIATLPTDSDGNVIVGTYILEYNGSYDSTVASETIAENSTYNYKYCNNIPTPDLLMESSCQTAQLEVTDTTATAITCNGSVISPVSYQYILLTKYPNTLATPIADVTTTDLPTIIGPNLWTGEFTSVITITYTYQVDTYLTVVGSGTKTETHEVVCSNCICQMRSCIDTVISRWIELKGTAPREAEVLFTKISKLLSYYMLYDIAARCGNEDAQSEYCGLMKEIINSSLTCCNQSDNSNEVSVEITPVSAGTGGDTYVGSKIIVDAYPTVSSLTGVGSDNDVAIDNSGTGNLYTKAAGTWTFQTSINGSDGTDGSEILIGSYPNVGSLGTSGTDGDMAVDSSGTGNFYQKGSGTWALKGSLLGPEGGVLLSQGRGLVKSKTLVTLDSSNFSGEGDTASIKAYVELVEGEKLSYIINGKPIFEIPSVSLEATILVLETEITNDKINYHVVNTAYLTNISGGTTQPIVSYYSDTVSTSMAVNISTSVTTIDIKNYTVKKFKL